MVNREKRMPVLNQGLGNKPQKLIPGLACTFWAHCLSLLLAQRIHLRMIEGKKEGHSLVKM